MDIRQAGGIHWPIFSLASVADNSDIGENKNARRTCVLRAEESG